MGRPPIQHHKLIISFDEDAKEVIEEVRHTFLLGKVSRAVGEATKGLLSHPVGYLGIIGAIVLAAHTIPGIREIVIGFEKKQAKAAGVAVE